MRHERPLEDPSETPERKRRRADGASVGAASGAAVGAAIGSIIPGLGTLIGAAVGGALGAAGGAVAGDSHRGVEPHASPPDDESSEAGGDHGVAVAEAPQGQVIDALFLDDEDDAPPEPGSRDAVDE